MVVGARETHVVVHADPFGQLDIHLGSAIVAFVTIATHIHEAVLVEIAHGGVETEFVAAAVDTGIMLLREGRAFVHHVVPVHVVDTVSVAVIPCHAILRTNGIDGSSVGGESGARADGLGVMIFLDGGHALGVEEHRLSLVGLRIVEPGGVVDGIHHVLAADQTAEAEAVVVVHFQSAVFAAALGGDKNHAERCAATVDARGGGILQHGDTLDVLGVDGAEVAFHTVDEDER